MWTFGKGSLPLFGNFRWPVAFNLLQRKLPAHLGVPIDTRGLQCQQSFYPRLARTLLIEIGSADSSGVSRS